MYSGIITIPLKHELCRQLPALHCTLVSRCSHTNVRNFRASRWLCHRWISSTLMTQASKSSETSVHSWQNIRCNIPKDNNLLMYFFPLCVRSWSYRSRRKRLSLIFRKYLRAGGVYTKQFESSGKVSDVYLLDSRFESWAGYIRVLFGGSFCSFQILY